MGKMPDFRLLLSPLRVGNVLLKNRIVSTGHHTYLADEVPGEKLIAYHRARAQGGVGLIILEVSGVHPTSRFSGNYLMATDKSIIPHYARVVDACHEFGATVFGQLFHPGKEIKTSSDGTQVVAYAPSSIPTDRFHIVPRVMSRALIEDIIAGYARAAELLVQAGLQGIEIVASHGYLPAQFLSEYSNQRNDEYGGNFENRLYFLRQVLGVVRAAVGDAVLGLRMTSDEYDPDGIRGKEVLQICQTLESHPGSAPDYYSLVHGSSATAGGAVYIAPPMGIDHRDALQTATLLKQQIHKPVLVTGRINQPQTAEQILSQGQADFCGMTRALICDPELPLKILNHQPDHIRACIGCNQACIGHANKGVGISCIQHPESGRELETRANCKPERIKRILVAGGGAAGMKAAVEGARHGHNVTLYEQSNRLGGLVNLAQQLPGRAEFGGLITNLVSELERHDVEICLNQTLDGDTIRRKEPDQVVLATGSVSHIPDRLEIQDIPYFSDQFILENKVNPGRHVVIADWRCDWSGMGLAEKLAMDGHQVTLCVTGALAGEAMPLYSRYYHQGRLDRLGVVIKPWLKLFGADNAVVYFQHCLNNDPVLVEDVDSMIICDSRQPFCLLENELSDAQFDVVAVGDCLAPRTAEEAILEGWSVFNREFH